jgi:hypothetical protein
VAETRSKAQFPMSEISSDPRSEDAAFQRGLTLGKEYAGTAVRRIGAWAEENPGQILMVGLAAGFVLGKLLFPRRRPVIEDLD